MAVHTDGRWMAVRLLEGGKRTELIEARRGRKPNMIGREKVIGSFHLAFITLSPLSPPSLTHLANWAPHGDESRREALCRRLPSDFRGLLVMEQK